MKFNFAFWKKKKTVNKTCQKCGASFMCTVGEGCWCENVYVSKENLSMIRRNYMDCLCVKCLKSFGPSEN